MLIELPQSQRLVVTVAFELNEDGTLRGDPRVVSPRNYLFDPPYRTAIERALHAIRSCAPYPFSDDPILREHYDSWDELEMTFTTAP